MVRRRRAAAAPGLRGIEDGPQRRRRLQGHRPHHQAEDPGRRAGPDHLLLRRQVHRADPAHEPRRPARAHRHQRRRDEHQHPLPRHAGGLRRLRRQRVHDHPDRPPVHVPLPHPRVPPPRHLLVPRPQPHHHPAPGDAGHRGHHHHRGRAGPLARAEGHHRAQLRAPRLPEGPHRRGGPGHPGLVADVPPRQRPEVPRHRHPPGRDEAPALLRAGPEHLLLPGFRRREVLGGEHRRKPGQQDGGGHPLPAAPGLARRRPGPVQQARPLQAAHLRDPYRSRRRRLQRGEPPDHGLRRRAGGQAHRAADRRRGPGSAA